MNLEIDEQERLFLLKLCRESPDLIIPHFLAEKLSALAPDSKENRLKSVYEDDDDRHM